MQVGYSNARMLKLTSYAVTEMLRCNTRNGLLLCDTRVCRLYDCCVFLELGGYMKKRILAAILFSWILSISGSAFGGPSIKYSEAITFPSCEFRVHFPVKTKRKLAYANGIKSIVVQSVYDGDSPFMRAECIPLEDPQKTVSAFEMLLENHARASGIERPEITIEEDKLGVVGTYAGLKKAGGLDIKLYGKVIIGSRSLLSLLVTEGLVKFPSDKSLYFLNAVEKNE